MEITKETLSKELLNWKPSIVFAAKNGIKLIAEVDGFNNPIYMIVEEGDLIKDFDTDFISARDYFIDIIN